MHQQLSYFAFNLLGDLGHAPGVSLQGTLRSGVRHRPASISKRTKAGRIAKLFAKQIPFQGKHSAPTMHVTRRDTSVRTPARSRHPLSRHCRTQVQDIKGLTLATLQRGKPPYLACSSCHAWRRPLRTQRREVRNWTHCDMQQKCRHATCMVFLCTEAHAGTCRTPVPPRGLCQQNACFSRGKALSLSSGCRTL
jgi:hypothetical protein